MAIWVYRCQTCGGTHEVTRRPAGAMLLRCTTLREWAWHDESAFVSASVPIGRSGAGVKQLAAKASGTTAGAAKISRRARPAARSRTASKSRAAVPRKRALRKAVRVAGSSRRRKERR